MVLVKFLSDRENLLFPKSRVCTPSTTRFIKEFMEEWGVYYRYYNLRYELHNIPKKNPPQEWTNELYDPNNPCNISFIMYSLTSYNHLDRYPYPSDYSQHHMFISQMCITYSYLCSLSYYDDEDYVDEDDNNIRDDNYDD